MLTTGRCRRALLLVAVALVACAAAPGATQAAVDPLEGRWEQVTERGQPFGGPTWDFVPTGTGTFVNKVVQAPAVGVCSGIDDQVKLSRSGGGYRGTLTEYPAIQPCRALRELEIDFAIRADGTALLTVKQQGQAQVLYFRRVLVRVGPIAFDYRERIDRAVRELAGQVATLGSRRDAVEAKLVQSRRAAEQALKELSRIDRDAAAVAKELDYIRRSYRRAGNDTQLLRRFAERERELRPKLLGVNERREGALRRGADAEHAIRNDLIERQRLDRSLVQLGLRMKGLDAFVGEIEIRAEGELVYRAALDKELFERLRAYKRTIAEYQAVVDGFDRERKEARAEFLAAQRAVSDSELRLAQQIWDSGLTRFYIDWAFSAYDVVAATAKGGIIGAIVEAQKQVLEHVLWEKAVDFVAPQPPPGTDPGSIEAEVSELYRGEIRSTFGMAATKSLGQRLVNETAIAWTTDTLAAEIANGVYTPAKYEAAYKAARDTFTRVQTRANFSAYTKAVKRFKRAQQLLGKQGDKIRELRGGYEFGFKALAKTLGTEVLKDAAQATLKAGLADVPEREAWIAFFEKDWYARALFPRFRAASSFYWDAYLQLQRLQEEEASHLSPEIQPGSGAQVLVTKPFPKAGVLRISLKGEGNPGRLAVIAGGAEAKPLGRYVYEVPARDVRVQPDGSISITIR